MKIIAEIIDTQGLKRTITRLAHEIIEKNKGADGPLWILQAETI